MQPIQKAHILLFNYKVLSVHGVVNLCPAQKKRVSIDILSKILQLAETNFA